MYILKVNDQQLEIKHYTVQRFTNDGHLLLTASIQKDSKTGNEMDALCDYIQDNAPVIAVYDKNDEKVQSLEGFRLKPIYGRSTDGATWELSIENSSELEYQYGLLRDRTAALEQENAALRAANEAQATVVADLNLQLLMVQMAAAELYEQSRAAEEPVESTEPEAAESEGE